MVYISCTDVAEDKTLNMVVRERNPISHFLNFGNSNVSSRMTNKIPQQQQLIQHYKLDSLTSPIRILIVNYEDDVNFALKLVLEEAYEDGIADKKNQFKVDCLNNPFSTLQGYKNGLYDL
jgi:hypothetical protein